MEPMLTIALNAARKAGELEATQESCNRGTSVSEGYLGNSLA